MLFITRETVAVIVLLAAASVYGALMLTFLVYYEAYLTDVWTFGIVAAGAVLWGVLSHMALSKVV